MYKGRSESQQRGSHYRDYEAIGPVVEKSVLGRSQPQCALGTDRHDEWLDGIEATVRTLSRNGFQGAPEVSRLLNR